MESINLTNTLAGLAAIQRAMAGEDILFTKLEIGDGVLTDTDVSKMTRLINKTKDYVLGAVDAEDSEIVRLRSNLSNDGVTQDLIIREYGIYAKFGNEQEFLFAYLNTGNVTTPLPSERIGRYELNRDFVLYIGNSLHVDFTSNGHLIYVSVNQYKDDMKGKANVEATIEDLKASKKYAVGDIVQVLGYYEPGDGGGHKRQKVAEGYLGEDKIIGNNGSIWKLIVTDIVNVKWFGAKGNKLQDDTDAIQNAINYTDRIGITIPNTESNSSTYDKCQKFVYFPQGRYLYTKLYFKHYIYMKGEKSWLISDIQDSYTIGCKDNSWNIFSGWRGKIENLMFTSKKLFQLNSRQSEGSLDNLDVGHLEIVDCNFKNCETIAEIDLQSCQVWFNKCLLENFKNIIVRACDGFYVKDCWLYPKENSLGDFEANFELKPYSGGYNFERNIWVPKPQSGKEVAYINMESQGRLYIGNGNRFGGEPGSYSVVNFKATNVSGSLHQINITDNYITTVAGSNTSCLMRLFTLPNRVNIQRNNGFVDTAYIMKVSSTIPNPLDILPADKNLNRIRYNIKDNSTALAYNKLIIDSPLLFLVLSKYEKNINITTSTTINYFKESTDSNNIIPIRYDFLNGEQYYPGEAAWATGIYDLDIMINANNYYMQSISCKLQVYCDYSDSEIRIKADVSNNQFPKLTTGGAEITKVWLDFGDGWVEYRKAPIVAKLIRIGIELNVPTDKVLGINIEKNLRSNYQRYQNISYFKK